MSFPDEESVSIVSNRLILDEQLYNQEIEGNEFHKLFRTIISEQKEIFEIITKDVHNGSGGVFFVYDYGGIGKTDLWKTVTSAIQSQDNIVLTVASNEIASLLLLGGRTSH
ncbi:uncharacterized protein LOC143620793 [Bidens hawaiensis]|uniref:uncharacterized protein LOC143620793 n=1 Tax=Bidens hawaiensis TaxID=980011 RepID=UPI004049A5AF